MCASQLEGLLVRASALLGMRFHAAGMAWLDSVRSPSNLARRTVREYDLIINGPLTKTFGMFLLAEIDADMIRRYQRQRETDGLSPGAINRECSVLQQILKRAGLWAAIMPDYRPLKRPKWKPKRIISEVERLRLFRVAAQNPNWEACLWFAIISVNTTAGPHELLSLRLQDIDLEHSKFTIPAEGAKRDMRVRPLTLNGDSWPAMKLAIERANKLGSVEPLHYLFPGRSRTSRKWNPEKPQTTFRTAWKKMTEAADLKGLKMYDLRRTAITDLLADENNSEETIRKAAGHLSREMLEHYSVRRIDKVRDALDRLAVINKKNPAHKVERERAKKPVEREEPETIRFAPGTWTGLGPKF